MEHKGASGRPPGDPVAAHAGRRKRVARTFKDCADGAGRGNTFVIEKPSGAFRLFSPPPGCILAAGAVVYPEGAAGRSARR